MCGCRGEWVGEWVRMDGGVRRDAKKELTLAVLDTVEPACSEVACCSAGPGQLLMHPHSRAAPPRPCLQQALVLACSRQLYLRAQARWYEARQVRLKHPRVAPLLRRQGAGGQKRRSCEYQ